MRASCRPFQRGPSCCGPLLSPFLPHPHPIHILIFDTLEKMLFQMFLPKRKSSLCLSQRLNLLLGPVVADADGRWRWRETHTQCGGAGGACLELDPCPNQRNHAGQTGEPQPRNGKVLNPQCPGQGSSFRATSPSLSEQCTYLGAAIKLERTTYSGFSF